MLSREGLNSSPTCQLPARWKNDMAFSKYWR